MSPTKRSHGAWFGWIVSAVLIAGSLVLWTQRQHVVDAVQYYQYQPTDDTRAIVQTAGLTEQSKFTFFATHPAVETSASFNQHCQRKEANSPILGCYSSNRIYIFNVTDERLDGLQTVTAAHELLHAEYERLPDSKKKHLEALLQTAYQNNNSPDLQARMKYYEKAEPGESFNELHSIAGTEFASLSPELETYYKQYFKDRQSLVRLHQKVDDQFTSLSKEADALVGQIENLADTINAATKAYNEDTASLNQSVSEFNARAARTGGFTSQQEFNAARAQLVARSNALNSDREQIQQNVAEYKSLLAKLDTINAESASLNQSLDSNLSAAPTI